MSGFIFFSVAPFQGRYFQALLDGSDLSGEVISIRQLPWPTLRGGWSALQRISWREILEEKCAERRLKRKYAGVLYRLLLRLELLLVALSIKTLLDTKSPTGVAVWNGSHRYCRLLMALAPASTRRFFFENGLLPKTTTVDPLGVNFKNSLPHDPEFYRRRGIAVDGSSFVLAPRQSKRDLGAPVELPERFIFFPFQVDSDTQIRFFSSWVRDMRGFFALAERMTEACNLPVVFKEHPSSKHEYPDLHARASDRLIFANANGTEELIRRSLFVVTVNSTVGLESLLCAKPVMTLGQACYNIEGLVAHADSEQSAIRLACDYPDWSLDDTVREGFIQYLRDEYCIPGSWQQPDQEHIERVVARLSSRG
jgi:capsular polysaccharide export protein